MSDNWLLVMLVVAAALAVGVAGNMALFWIGVLP